MSRSVEPKLYVLVPCYNEEEVFEISLAAMSNLLNEFMNEKVISSESRIFFIDDGSRDSTWSLIERAHANMPIVNGIKLAANAGHQNALMAGMLALKDQADVYVTIDADLQDDPQAIRGFLEEYKKGFDVVYGVRNDRTTDSLFKRTTAQMFYRISVLAGVNMLFNHADFRLYSNKIVHYLAEYKEVNLFLRAIFPKLTKNYSVVYYKRSVRAAGESKYPFRKMLSFALHGITSFSSVPLKFISFLGFFSLILSFSVLIWVIRSWLLGETIQGWSSLLVIMMFFFSIQLLAIGVIGEYLGNMYIELKGRPRFLIDKILK